MLWRSDLEDKPERPVCGYPNPAKIHWIESPDDFRF
jgi:hypothetical protein